MAPEPQQQLLTAEQLAHLPAGTIVRVTWSGGNGPWDYELGFRGAVPFVWMSWRAVGVVTKYQGPILDSVGSETFNTRVTVPFEPRLAAAVQNA